MRDRSSLTRLTGFVLVLASLLASCSRSDASAELAQPAKVEEVSGRAEKQVTFTPEAASRVELDTSEIGTGPRGTGTVVPYSAVLYDIKGSTWTYVTDDGLSFIREPITVERIVDGTAYLTQSPPAGTRIAVVAVALLYGAETGVGK